MSALCTNKAQLIWADKVLAETPRQLQRALTISTVPLVGFRSIYTVRCIWLDCLPFFPWWGSQLTGETSFCAQYMMDAKGFVGNLTTFGQLNSQYAFSICKQERLGAVQSHWCLFSILLTASTNLYAKQWPPYLQHWLAHTQTHTQREIKSQLILELCKSWMSHCSIIPASRRIKPSAFTLTALFLQGSRAHCCLSLSGFLTFTPKQCWDLKRFWNIKVTWHLTKPERKSEKKNNKKHLWQSRKNTGSRE